MGESTRPLVYEREKRDETECAAALVAQVDADACRAASSRRRREKDFANTRAPQMDRRAMNQEHSPNTLFDPVSLRAAGAECRYSVALLAERMRISPRHLRRLFRKHLGCSPDSWVREQRMQMALSLLPSASCVKEVAYALSFRHPPQFCREFRARFGCSPRQYRELSRRRSNDGPPFSRSAHVDAGQRHSDLGPLPSSMPPRATQGDKSNMKNELHQTQ